MNYEKKYKEALERAKSAIKECGDNKGCITMIEEIFPELEESEDEQNIKDLIDELKCSLRAANCQNDACGGGHEKRIALLEWSIAWLEKQGKEEYSLKSFKDKDVRKFMQYIEKQAKAYEFNLPNRSYDIYAFAKDILVWLEKQGQVKESAISQHDNTTCKENDNSLTRCETALEATKEAKVENANEVEPKFDVDDWVVTDKGDTVQIVAVNNSNYTLYNRMKFGIFYVDKFWHKWTIKDAKAGDVLASYNSVFIFQREYIAGKPIAYCGIMNGCFVQGLLGCWTNEQCYPATKAQCDLLFYKMKEEGYVWDEKKLKLKKRIE